MDELLSHNDAELYNLQEDASEVNNLAVDPARYGDPIAQMNDLLNVKMASEVGENNGQELPFKDAQLVYPIYLVESELERIVTNPAVSVRVDQC